MKHALLILGTLCLLCGFVAPVMAQDQDAPPVSATILSITDRAAKAGAKRAKLARRISRITAPTPRRVVRRSTQLAKRRETLRMRERRAANTRRVRSQQVARAPKPQPQTTTETQIPTQKATGGNETKTAASPSNPTPVTPKEMTQAAEKKPAPTETKTEPKPTAGTTQVDPLQGTKPDPFSTAPKAETSAKPIDSPAETMQGGLKMFLYLVPVLGIALGGAWLVRKIQAKKTDFPQIATAKPLQISGKAQAPTTTQRRLWEGVKSSPLFGKARVEANELKLLESMAVGTGYIHLVEIRDRHIVIGATPSSITLLTELREEKPETREAFQRTLQSAATKLEGYSRQEALPSAEALEQIDERLRETHSAVVRSAERLRALREDL